MTVGVCTCARVCREVRVGRSLASVPTALLDYKGKTESAKKHKDPQSEGKQDQKGLSGL